MKSLFEEMGGTYRQVGDYLIPNLVLPDDSNYQIGKYGRMRRSYLKEHRKSFIATMWWRLRCSSIYLRSTKPAKTVWKSSYPPWRNRRV